MTLGRILPVPTPGRPIVILSAGMGAGHHGVSRELGARLEARSWPSVVLDVLDELPLHLGRLLPPLYLAMLRRAPSAYEGICTGWFSTDVVGIHRRLAGNWSELGHGADTDQFRRCRRLQGTATGLAGRRAVTGPAGRRAATGSGR